MARPANAPSLSTNPMKALNLELTLWLQTAAGFQLAVAILNLFLVRILDWKEELARLPLLIREVFRVHSWFISLTLFIFATMTWRFAGEIARASDPFVRWLATGVGIFWGTRFVLQFAYYSSSHWRGHAARTLVHGILLITYGGMALVYLIAAL